MARILCFTLSGLIALVLSPEPASAEDPAVGLYDRQVAENLAKFESNSLAVRPGAAEALGFLRAYAARHALARQLQDDSADVRRQAAMAWIKGSLPPEVEERMRTVRAVNLLGR